MNLDGDYGKLSSYVRDIANRMGLRDWTIVISEEPVDIDTGDGQIVGASCNVVYGRKRAKFQFNPDWAEDRPDDLRHLVVHELMHCHFVPVQWHHNNARAAMSNGEWVQYDSAFHDVMEMHIDAVADAWADVLPLPPEKKRKK